MATWTNYTAVAAPRNGTASHTVAFPAAESGSLLALVVVGAVTTTIDTAGWTQQTTALNDIGVYLFTKTASAAEASVTMTHNGSNYPVEAVVIEFAPGSTYVTSDSAVGLDHETGPSPEITGLSGNTWVASTVAIGLNGPDLNYFATLWSGAAGIAQQSEREVLYGVTDGYGYSLAFVEDYPGSTFQPTGNMDHSGGTPKHAITFAIKVNEGPPPPEPALPGFLGEIPILSASFGDTSIIRAYLGDTLLFGDVPPDPPADLVDPLTPSGATPNGLPSYSGDLVFSDEFTRTEWANGKWLPHYEDTSFWNATVPGGHLTNTNEPQGYDISAWSMIPDVGARATLSSSPDFPVVGLDFKSGMGCSFESMSLLGGYFEIRCRLPLASGPWPAFWLFPTNQEWAAEGEIDIMEHYGANWIRQGTILANGVGVNTSEQYGPVGGFNPGNFNTYAAWWEPGERVRFYVNGTLTKTDTSANVPSSPMHMHLNLAGDKDNHGGVTANAPFSMDVQYVRAWALPA